MNRAKFIEKYALAITLVLVIFLMYALYPFLQAFFGAIILYVLFAPLYIKIEKKTGKHVSAIIILIITLLFVLIPLLTITSLVAGEVNSFITNTGTVKEITAGVESLLNINIQESIQKFIANSNQFISGIFNFIGSATSLTINLLIMYFVLFYMLIYSTDLRKTIRRYIPFNEKNTDKLLDELKRISYATFVTTGIIALMQGTLLGAGLWFFGFPGAMFWGFIGVLMAFLPVIGIGGIWVPAAAIGIIQHNYFAGIGILIWGIILSSADNLIRPLLNRKFGRIHPLVSLVGIFAGLALFGVVGIILGPLLLSWTLLIIGMFEEEYLFKGKTRLKPCQ